jgi:hypothetical protein
MRFMGIRCVRYLSDLPRHCDRHEKQAEAGKKNKGFHTLFFSWC